MAATGHALHGGKLRPFQRKTHHQVTDTGKHPFLLPSKQNGRFSGFKGESGMTFDKSQTAAEILPTIPEGKMIKARHNLQVFVTDLTLADHEYFGDPIHILEPHRELRETTGVDRYRIVKHLEGK